ncbi:haloacid dehalogenase-like hydrolase [Streptomyces sp. NBC_01435]|uniref:haloacid dehalogenase-like hydrolase n=1 Tax=Streptomyces sp. NBC_01435 TaxID=2903865 RepID=UPI002E2EA698|nr:haloacid dehalogenase-like hydrolase [Streptomyces sp. NBC_01435]
MPVLRPAPRSARRAVTALALAAALATVTTPAQARDRPGPGRSCPRLTVSTGWYGANQARIQRVIDRYGNCAPHHRDGRAAPVAVFDWDNTVIKNDVGDATMFWLLRNSRIRQPEHGDWRTTSRYLTDAAARSLRAACPDGTGPDRTLPTATYTACADEILSVYSEAATTSGQDAFAGYDRRTMEPSYAWLAQLTHGWTAAQVRAFAAAARAENLAAPVGATQRVGSTTDATGYVRYYDQQRDLIRTLRRAGFDVWIVSASPQPVVDIWARGVVAPGNVIGIRSTTERGRYTSHLGSCGTERPGDDAQITYIDGKRCWINKEIFGVRGAAASRVQAPTKRPVFAAGDSDTDVSMLRDATGLRLALNRNKAELMCRSYDDADGRWLVNPMFIGPKGRMDGVYPCATAGYTASDGTSRPVRRGDGSVIPDQQDTVFAG